ncbi:MAG: hypothetical protein LUE61_04990 [Clostridiales bacterium]|nr:hypothetical protein [Clostridiales bacterium]
MNQIGLRSLLGIAYNDCSDFIVVVNPRVMSYVLTAEIQKHGIHLPDSISFGKGELAENEVYIGLLNGFELRLKKYLELLDRLSATVLPRQKHTGIEHIVHGYDEKKKDVQNTTLELMYQLEKFEEMHSFINSLSITRSEDTELAYWDIKALEGLGKHSFALEKYQIDQERFSTSQQHELAELLGVEMP